MAQDAQAAESEQLDGLPTIRSHRRLLEVMSLVCSAYYWLHSLKLCNKQADGKKLTGPERAKFVKDWRSAKTS